MKDITINTIDSLRQIDEVDQILISDGKHESILRVHWKYNVRTILYQGKIFHGKKYVDESLRFEVAENINNHKLGWINEQFKSRKELNEKYPDVLTSIIDPSQNCTGFAFDCNLWIDPDAVRSNLEDESLFETILSPTENCIAVFMNSNGEYIHFAKCVSKDLFSCKHGYRETVLEKSIAEIKQAYPAALEPIYYRKRNPGETV
jgi:hypothetical protein